MEPIYVNSIQVDAAQVAAASKEVCFTTLPVRISKYADIADEAMNRCLQDWGKHINDDREKLSKTTFSEHGNFNAFVFAEAMPERLGLVSYVNDLAFLDDGKVFYRCSLGLTNLRIDNSEFSTLEDVSSQFKAFP
jgi:ophiobolin F synthase